MGSFLHYLVVAVSVAAAFSKPADERAHRLVRGQSKLSDLEHEVNGEHNYGYDHEVFLGKEEAKTFDQLTPEESKQRLRIIVKKIDKDADGLVTKKELKDWVNYIHTKYIWDDTGRRWTNDREQEAGGKMTWTEYLTTSYNNEPEEMLVKRPGYADGLRRDKRRWKEADENGDSELTIEEYAAFVHPEEFDHMKDIYVDEVLETMDTDKDGFVSQEEYMADLYQPEPDEEEKPEWVESERIEFGRTRDLNKDGKMDKEELKEMLVPNTDLGELEAIHLIYEADADKDGKLSEEEIIDQYDVFVGSQATDFGEALAHHDEL